MSDGITGQAINLMSNDVSRFDWAMGFTHDLWGAPLGSAIAGYLIYTQIGYAGLIGMALLIVLMPLQGKLFIVYNNINKLINSLITFTAWLGKKTAVIRLETALRTDKRIKQMISILNGIQVIKMYAWEQSFAKTVSEVRHKEMESIARGYNIKASLLSFYILTKIAIFITLVAHYFMGNSITAQQTFVTIAFFDFINQNLAKDWPFALTSIAEAFVSVKRIQDFLTQNMTKTKETVTKDPSLKVGIKLRNATAYWNQDDSANIGLLSVDLEIGNENLTVITGQVGSGKTTLLELFLKELPLTDGDMNINGTISYAAQQSWIFEGSIKDNILFTQDFDEKRYKMIVHVCSLERDFELLPHGDQTIVGDRGVSLSGGQKARINLARAIYKKADIYLLDDPLSAVDVHVGKHIFEKCIKDFLKVCHSFNYQDSFIKYKYL